jgi:GTP-binding protein
MAKPVVAVVGRPNVGKSTLVNRICQTRDAIVHESRGVTRDRSYHEAEWSGHEFVLIDTGGIESLKSKDVFAPRIREQAIAATQEADVILFVVDGATGVTEEDEAVARILRKAEVPVFLLVNKLDDPANDRNLYDFYSLGVAEPTPISAVHGHGTGDLLDDIVAAFPEEPEVEYPEGVVNIALIGRPNVGKSSLLNRLSGTERSIVSDVAGTTRDAIDIMVEHEGVTYRFVDTAGMRKRTVVTEDVEYYSYVRGLRAIDEADVCLLVVDAEVGVTEQDQKIAGMAIERGCALVVLLNKWDLMTTDAAREECLKSLELRLNFAKWAPYLRVSALSGRSVSKIWPLVNEAVANRAQVLSTPAINNLLARIRETGHTIVRDKKRLRVQYGTQTASRPPLLTFFVNHPELCDDSYKRFLENRLRETFDLTGTPIRLRFRRKE